tara:strand:- start:572 stop:1201 length:630 start_codon:yes stop_codon:yes gene_type:complete
MIYQGHTVNFSQIDSTQQRINTSVNLDLYKYPQNPYLASARSDSDIWKHIGEQIQGTAGSNEHYSWGANPNALNPRVNRNTNAIQALDNKIREILSMGTGGGMTREQVEDIVENYHGDDIALLYSNHAEQEGRITDGFNDRQRIDAKADATQAEHGDFHNKLQTLGDKMLEHVNSPHNQGGGGNGLGLSLPIIAVGGIAAYFLLKGKKK